MRKISELLVEKRKEKGLTLDEIERETKIKREFLEAIEKAQFDKLPSESYAIGFVKNYSKFLGIPASLSVPLFRREYASKSNVHIIPEFRKTQHKFNKPFFFSAKWFVIIAVIFVICIYIFFQYSSLIFPPSLTVDTPKEGQILSGNTVEVTGETDPYATLLIEGDEVYVNLQGKFRKTVYLFSGDEKIDVVAKNRFGKTTTKSIGVKVK